MKIKQLKDSELDIVLQEFDRLLSQNPPKYKAQQDTAQLLLFPVPNNDKE
mgnify:CR=1 FL=1